jgi:hypothetical protein
MASLAATHEFNSLWGVNSSSSVRGVKTEGHNTRNTVSNIVPFVVDQGNESTCAFVALAKVLTYNLLGLVMDIELLPEEKRLLNNAIKEYKIDPTIPVFERDFYKYYTPEKCSLKGFTLIVIFFYFFDFARNNGLSPSFNPGEKLEVFTKMSGKSYDSQLTDILFPFLKLTKDRFGGNTPVAAGFVTGIIHDLNPKVRYLTWQKVSLCTFRTEFCTNAPYVGPELFQRFCNEVIFPFTSKLKIIITLAQNSEEHALHDVVLFGIENDHILISNSWGERLDSIKISSFPLVSLTIPGNPPVKFTAFQYTFLMPITPSMRSSMSPLKEQYYGDDFEEFMTGMKIYLSRFNELDDIPKIEHGLLQELAKIPRNLIGGKRKNKRSKRYTRKCIKRSFKNRL